MEKTVLFILFLAFSSNISYPDLLEKSDDAEGRQLRVPDNLLLVAAVGFLAGLLGYATEGASAETAVCTFRGDGSGNIRGTVTISQRTASDQALFSLNLSGLTPGKHGFHVHQNGELGDDCVAAGGHYNPFMKNHGGPTSDERHVGDLGNIQGDSEGKVLTQFTDPLATLLGAVNVRGKAIVVHAGEDDLGLGGDLGSISTGNAGPRLGCCLIV